MGRLERASAGGPCRVGSRHEPAGRGARSRRRTLDKRRDRARVLGVSERTIESHVSTLLRRFGVSDRVALSPTSHRTPSGPAASPLLWSSSRASPVALPLRRVTRLLQRWTQAARGRTLLFLVTGEPGIGKTRLVAELARRVHGEGAGVLLGASADGSEPPYQPLFEALGPNVRERILEHAERSVTAIYPGWAQAHMQSAVIEELGRLTSTGPILLILEDLHSGFAGHTRGAPASRQAPGPLASARGRNGANG